MEAKKRNHRLLRAEFHKRKGDIRDMYQQKMRILKGVRGKITRVEAELIEAKEQLSQDFSSGAMRQKLYSSTEKGSLSLISTP